MQRALSLLFLITVLFPLSLHAAGAPITRSEGLKLIWEPLKRTPEETNEPGFTDLPASHPDHLLTNFAKARGVVEDGSRFYPDEPLRLNAALLWLLRSRNVDFWENVRFDSIRRYVEKYALFEDPAALVEENPSLAPEELGALMETLDSALKNEIHTVSYYSDEFAGRNTAFGEIFDPNALTAAHQTFPHNTLVRVTNEENDRSVVVRINDRGPFINERTMDLSRAAFQRIGSLSEGVLRNVTLERIGHAGSVTECSSPHYQRRFGVTILTPGIPAVAEQGSVLTIAANHAVKPLLIRMPGKRVERNAEWTDRLVLEFEKPGIATIVLHTDSGRRRRFRVKVTEECL